MQLGDDEKVIRLEKDWRCSRLNLQKIADHPDAVYLLIFTALGFKE